MSNSPLISYTKISPNSNPRQHKIDKITIHHMAGNLTVEACGEEFSRKSRQASANYGVGTDGRIALYVDEANRAWTSSNKENDHRAVTIEVANDSGAPDWHVSSAALQATIDLCVDICRRNGIEKLVYTGEKSGNLTMHRWFAATLCPGPYLASKLPYIAEEVNRRLASSDPGQKTEILYRVRLSWKNEKSQLGAFRSLENAKTACPGGYTVYDWNGRAVYTKAHEKSIDDIAREVIAGKWGDNPERKQRITAAGYDYAAVQAAVNKILG